MRGVSLLCVLLLLALAAHGVTAQGCSSHTTQAACGADATCIFNTLNARCYTAPAACPTLTLLQCSQRSDCRSSGGVCVTGAFAPACGNFTTGVTCQGANCFWSSFTSLPTGSPPTSGGGQCFNSIQEVEARFACSHWDYYPNSQLEGGVNEACLVHGCSQTGALCVDAPYVDVDGGYSPSVSSVYTLTPPIVVASNQTFKTQALFVLTDFFPASTTATVKHYSISLGTQPSPTNYDALLTSGNDCSTVLTALPYATGLPIVDYSDRAALQTYFINAVTSTGVFPTGSNAADLASRRVTGSFNFTSTGLLRSASITGGNVALNLEGNLASWATKCNVPRVEMATFVRYTPTFWITARTVSNTGVTGLVATSSTFTVDLYTYGSYNVQTTSKYLLEVDPINIANTQAGCPAGKVRRTYTARLAFDNAFDSTKLVGVPALANVRVPPATSCFGLYAVAIRPPTACTSFTCVTEIDLSSRCEDYQADGNGLSLCSYATTANRNADLAVWNAVTPGLYTFPDSTYDYFYGFAYDLGSWAVASSPSTAVLDPAVQPVLQIRLDLAADPTTTRTDSLAVSAGFLPLPTSPITAILPQVVGVTSFTSAADLSYLGNAALYFNRVLTFAVYFGTVTERTTNILTLDLSTLRIDPLDPQGLPIVTTPAFLSWSDIASSVTSSPRQHVCPTCVLSSVAAAQVGVDGFAISVPLLRNLMGANGYKISGSWNVTLPTAPANSRRLFQVSSSSSSTGEVSSSSTAAVGSSTAVAESSTAADGSSSTAAVESSTGSSSSSTGATPPTEGTFSGSIVYPEDVDPTLGVDAGTTTQSTTTAMGAVVGAAASVLAVSGGLGFASFAPLLAF